MPLVPEFHWCQSLVPVRFNIAHVLFVCRQLAPATGTRKLISVTEYPFTPAILNDFPCPYPLGQCSVHFLLLSRCLCIRDTVYQILSSLAEVYRRYDKKNIFCLLFSGTRCIRLILATRAVDFGPPSLSLIWYTRLLCVIDRLMKVSCLTWARTQEA